MPPRPFDDPRFDHVEHVSITIIVVADVLLVQPWHGRGLVGGAHVRPVPLHDQGLSVRVDRWPQHQDDVVQDRAYLRVVVSGDQVVSELDGVLRVGDFTRVKAAVDIYDGLAGTGELPRLLVAEAFGMCKPLGYLPVAFEVGKILR